MSHHEDKPMESVHPWEAPSNALANGLMSPRTAPRSPPATSSQQEDDGSCPIQRAAAPLPKVLSSYHPPPPAARTHDYSPASLALFRKWTDCFARFCSPPCRLAAGRVLAQTAPARRRRRHCQRSRPPRATTPPTSHKDGRAGTDSRPAQADTTAAEANLGAKTPRAAATTAVPQRGGNHPRPPFFFAAPPPPPPSNLAESGTLV